jgi:hypothetical protein
MSKTLKVMGLLVTVLAISFLVSSFRASSKVVAAPEDPATFKEALAKEKTNNAIRVELDGATSFRIKLVDVKDDYIVTEVVSGQQNAGQIAYVPFLSIRSVTKHVRGGLTLHIR